MILRNHPPAPLVWAVLACAMPSAGDWPRTVPESTRHARTSTVAEVRGFMAALSRRAPALVPYRPRHAPMATEAGKPLLAWRLPAASKDALRVYLNANIHAGEVEGKEAVQLIVREFLQGLHPAARRHLDLVVCPAYNADGTDALDPAIRRYQPNPESGVGRRENSRGLDLNRDLMKAQAANTRWFLAMLKDFDPAVVFDLHTTNGSYHGFHLTYAPSLALGADPDLLTFNRRLLNEVRDGLKSRGLPAYDYGNFRPESLKPGEVPAGWETFDFRPRYLSNYPGLQNRLAILSEAYVYRSYADRIADTRTFVLACLDWIAAHRGEVRRVLGEARRHWMDSWQAGTPSLPLAADFALTERHSFDVVQPLKDADGRVIGEASRATLDLPSFVTWAPRESIAVPEGYLVDAAYAFKVRPVLEAHGIKVLPGSARPRSPLNFFHETSRTVAAQFFQGSIGLTLKGAWTPEESPLPKAPRWTRVDLDQALYVPLDQPLGRVAFYLLDPRSPDGLVTWGFFHESLLRSDGAWGEPLRFPILAVGGAHDIVGADPGPSAKKAE
ncbi:MAG: hypothetical protein IPQ13_06515 [Holophagaceae bacterium]|nr:hypothetical protein [Holophagaceae bacterium]